MFKKLLGAAAMAAVVYAVVPAHAAKVGGGCSGDNLAKTESTIDIMADGPNKITAQKEVAMAQDAMLAARWARAACTCPRRCTPKWASKQDLSQQDSGRQDLGAGAGRIRDRPL